MNELEIIEPDWQTPTRTKAVMLDGVNVTNRVFTIEMRVDGTFVYMYDESPEMVWDEEGNSKVRSYRVKVGSDEIVEL